MPQFTRMQRDGHQNSPPEVLGISRGASHEPPDILQDVQTVVVFEGVHEGPALLKMPVRLFPNSGTKVSHCSQSRLPALSP